jgi:hypothetical protein
MLFWLTLLVWFLLLLQVIFASPLTPPEKLAAARVFRVCWASLCSITDWYKDHRPKDDEYVVKYVDLKLLHHDLQHDKTIPEDVLVELNDKDSARFQPMFDREAQHPVSRPLPPVEREHGDEKVSSVSRLVPCHPPSLLPCSLLLCSVVFLLLWRFINGFLFPSEP